jgi:FolB domain-containing protein
MDRITIAGLTRRCIIGTKPAERRRKQRVVIDIDLQCDLSRAGRTDDLADTVNYRTIEKGVAAIADSNRNLLLESLAREVSAFCLEQPGVVAVTVTLRKPDAPTLSSVSITIHRRRGKHR